MHYNTMYILSTKLIIIVYFMIFVGIKILISWGGCLYPSTSCIVVVVGLAYCSDVCAQSNGRGNNTSE